MGKLSRTEKLMRKEYGRLSFSQEGEDILLFIAAKGREKGFYIDIGAHHPYKFSNTQLLYDLGWNGINIDATPGSMQLFKKHRPHDINLEIGISNEKKEITFYQFKESAFNTFCEETGELRIMQKHSPLLDKYKIETLSLSEVVKTYVPPKKNVDILSIDVEGYELSVLDSNDWESCRPEIIAIEDLNVHSLEGVSDSPVYQYLKKRGYTAIAKTRNTIILSIRK